MTAHLTAKVRRVLEAIHTLDQAWGLAICQTAGLGSGTVYPILERLRQEGWIGSRQEAHPAPGRPARTFYHLTYRGQLGAGLEPSAAHREGAADEATTCEHSFPDPYPAPLDQPGDCRYCGTSYQTAKRNHNGPSVRECAEADERWWGGEKTGE